MHSTEDEKLKKLIKVERIKRKLLPEETNLEHVGKSIIFEKPVENEFQRSKPIMQVRHTFLKTRPPKKIIHRETMGRISKPKLKPSATVPVSGHTTRNTEELIEKLNKLIYDKNVQMIECAGPGRNVLVKVRNNVNVTKLNFNEAEIKNVIMYFSDLSRIPIVGGILKTSIESMMISAVVSEYAGSRFIISKKNPYDLIREA